jgi:hypothetical protein
VADLENTYIERFAVVVYTAEFRDGNAHCIANPMRSGHHPAGRSAIGTAMDSIKKLLIWSAIAALALLAIMLPVIVVTGMFGGKPLVGTIALIGLVLLAFGIAWYVRTHDQGS